jgi:hypothetical protein
VKIDNILLEKFAKISILFLTQNGRKNDDELVKIFAHLGIADCELGVRGTSGGLPRNGVR